MKVLLAVLLSALLVSCDASSARNAVRKQFPGSEITTLPEFTTKFIVRTPDNEIWFAESEGAAGENSMVYKTLLIPSPTKDYVSGADVELEK